MKYMHNRLIVIYHHHSYCSQDKKLTNCCPYDIPANEFAKQMKTPRPENMARDLYSYEPMHAHNSL